MNIKEIDANGQKLNPVFVGDVIHSLYGFSASDLVWIISPAQEFNIVSWISETLSPVFLIDKQSFEEAVEESRDEMKLLKVKCETSYSMPLDEALLQILSTGETLVRIFNLYVEPH